jgi:hypothetical protein
MRTVLCEGKIVITKKDTNQWEISAISLEYLDWLRETYGHYENNEWIMTYYSGSMTLIQVYDEEITNMSLLRWS